MVDVGGKEVNEREAVAYGEVKCGRAYLDAVKEGSVKKGHVVEVARLAGMMGAKETGRLVPLCHVLPLDCVEVTIEILDDRFSITAKAKACAKTGVEMEAMTAVMIAGLTIYDMGKAIDREMVIGEVKLLEKRGGKSGEYLREDK
ncbi:Cyclic pyranopterin monophosphate synthase accessory protein [Poriferisphaera corsica]|uniref:cyclic pyranopterin monophosphate synthase n=2 Tax=Poriferisphaera corsica TaxID=2528020 RepID=A0A517YSV9_9BACT|nr:Cyclic pyranopterin monophosphate synthase accessory protein [Poriferisphaera corsica]